MLGHHKGADGRQGSRQADLEAAGDRHHPVTLETREDAIGGDRRVRVSQRPERDTVRARALREADSRQRSPAVEAGRHHLKLLLGREDRQLPDDPVGSGAGLPVGDAAQAIANLGGESAEDGLWAGQRHAAD